MLSHHCEMSTARRSCGWRLACLQAVGVLNEHVLLSKTFEADFFPSKAARWFSCWIFQIGSRFLQAAILKYIYVYTYMQYSISNECLYVSEQMYAYIDTHASVCGPPSCRGPLAQARLYLGGWFSLFLYLRALLAGWERPTTGICCLCVWPPTFR